MTHATPPSPGPDDRVPSSTPFSRRAVFPDDGPAPAPSAAGAAVSDRLRVLSLLFIKMQELDKAVYRLQILPREGLTYAQLEQIAAQIMEARSESGVCEARHGQIDYGGPFKPLPPGAQAGLLAAIRAVEAHTGGAAALTGLLQAIHGLVVAYGGKDA